MSKPRERSLIFTLAWETVADLEDRGWNRPPDRLIAEMLGVPEIARMAIAEPSRNPLVALARSPRLRTWVVPPAAAIKHRFVFSPHHFGGRKPLLAKARFERYGHSLAAAARAAGLEQPVIVTTDPRVAAFSQLSFASRVVYFARDDWASHHGYVSDRDQLVKSYERMRAARTDVVAVSDPLLERLAPTGRGLVLPNGIEPAEWSQPGEPPDWFAALPRPRFLYVGTIDSRIDIDWIRAISAEYPQASIVLAGPDRDHDVWRSLAAIPGVRLPGNLYERTDVVNVIRASDVCLLPHVRSDLTEAMDPLKLYEYLAGGRPVVATDLRPVREHGEDVVLVGDLSGLGAAVKQALARPAMSEEARLAFLAEHSWKSRTQDLLRFVFADGAGAI